MVSNPGHADFLPASRRDLLANLLWKLASGQWKGTLHLNQGNRHWSLTLAGRRIRGIDIWNGRDLRLGSLLRLAGQATTVQTDRAADLARHQCRLAGQVLTDQGLPGHWLEEALRTQARLRFSRFMDQAQGWIHLEPAASIPVRASLGKPLDLARALITWAKPAQPPLAPGKERTWTLRPGGRRAALDLAEILPPELRQGVVFRLGTGPVSWQTLRRWVMTSPKLGVSFLEFLWSWLGLLEHLHLVAPGPAGQDQRRQTTRQNKVLRDERTVGRGGVLVGAPPDDEDAEALRRWWHQMARRYHPDSNPDADPGAFREAHSQYLAALARLKEQT